MYYPVIDGDSILYRCGFAAQHKYYYSEIDGGDYPSMKALKEAGMADKPYIERVEVEPVEFALGNVKATLTAILEATSAADYTIYVSGNKPTFRDKFARIKPYKGNRPADGKPVHYDACKQYIIDVWRAEECFALESDDYCALHQAEVEGSIIVSNDKDLQQCPGMHYNWTKDDGIYVISPEEALHWKYIQILSGDATDNIEGIPGLGTLGAEKLLKHMFGSEEHEYNEVCSMYYEEFFSDDRKPIKNKAMTPAAYAHSLGMTPAEIYNETKVLITIIQNGTDQIEWENY